MRKSQLVNLVFLFAVMAPSLHGQESAASKLVHVDPGTEVTFDLERGRIPNALPFDVSFVLLTGVAPTSKTIESRLGDPDRTERDGCRVGNDILPSHLFNKTEGTTTKKMAEISMPELRPDEDYCLEIDLTRDRTPEESKKIVETLRQPLIELYRAQDEQAVVDEAGSARFRKRLLAVIERVVAPARVVPEPDSFLNPNEAFAPVEVRKRFEEPFERGLQARQAVARYLEVRPTLHLRREPLLTRDPSVAEIDEELDAIQTDLAHIDTTTSTGKAFAKELTFMSQSLEDAKRSLARRDAAINRVAQEIDDWLVDHYDVVATTTQTFEARFHWYVSADLGLGIAPETDHFFRYVGMNVYFKPVNKRAPLRRKTAVRGGDNKPCPPRSLLCGIDFRKRLAATVGLADKLTGSDRSGVLNDRPILLGAGWRITDHIRISVGGLFINEDDPDPLVTKKSLAVTPYVSASIDFDVANTLKSFFDTFTSN